MNFASQKYETPRYGFALFVFLLITNKQCLYVLGHASGDMR